MWETHGQERRWQRRKKNKIERKKISPKIIKANPRNWISAIWLLRRRTGLGGDPKKKGDQTWRRETEERRKRLTVRSKKYKISSLCFNINSYSYSNEKQWLKWASLFVSVFASHSSWHHNNFLTPSIDFFGFLIFSFGERIYARSKRYPRRVHKKICVLMGFWQEQLDWVDVNHCRFIKIKSLNTDVPDFQVIRYLKQF